MTVEYPLEVAQRMAREQDEAVKTHAALRGEVVRLQEFAEKVQIERDELRAEVERLGDANADLRMSNDNLRSLLAQSPHGEAERLRAHVEGAEAVIELGKVWWLGGGTHGVAREALLDAIGTYDPATWNL